MTTTRIYNSEGYSSPIEGDLGGFNYYYYRKDHLGNNREVWKAPSCGGGLGEAEVVQTTNYYPSGLPWAYTTDQVQPYMHNGTEFIEMFGYDMYDSQFRWYDPTVPHTTTLDPHAEMYYSISPYSWLAGNLINRVDPTGMSIDYLRDESTFVNPNGEVIYHIDDNDNLVYQVNDEKSWIEGGRKKDGLKIVGFENPYIDYNTQIGKKYNLYIPPGLGLVDEMNWSDNTLDLLEIWLDKDPSGAIDFLLKVLTEMSYGTANSAYAVVMHRTIGGRSLTSPELAKAFGDIAPSIITGGLAKSKLVLMLKEGGLAGYNEFVKTLGSAARQGRGWQKAASEAFQNNKVQQEAIKFFKYIKRALDLGNSAEKHTSKN